MSITSLNDATEFPLCWPTNKPRSASREQDPWGAKLPKAHAKVEDEMRKIGARGWVVSMAPGYRTGPVDPAVAVWFNAKPKGPNLPADLRVFACDRFVTAAGNLHAIGLTIDRLRAIERYGAYSVEQATEGARAALPPPEREPDWWAILGVGREWPLVAIEAVYRDAAKTAHPDQGGDAEKFKAMTAAIEAARAEKAAS